MLILGIDTGGTYTDGVILERETRRIVCSAKALTTPRDLVVGVRNCIRALPFTDWDKIGQVSLSTTLATNAIVEGRGCPVGLLLLGRQLERDIPAQRTVVLDARVDIRGGVKERLDRQELENALEQLRGHCEAVAVSGYASVRNPQLELSVAQAARQTLGLPVVCGHELTGSLGFYERTVTAVLNARLIPIIRNLIQTVQRVMRAYGIHAPIMVVRGDGSMMRADYAVERPVETVLSGPAASVIGAKFLSGKRDCVVVDMGGTTTDIACLHDGMCAVSSEGAMLGGWQTKVRALEICTYGLGGDSEIHIHSADNIQIGPRRVVPLCRADGSEESGLTPTDVLHATGEYEQWNVKRVQRALDAQPESGLSGIALAKKLRDCITDRLAWYCQAGMRAFGRQAAMLLVGVGAPARIWLSDAAEQLGIPAILPPYAQVANAVGAAVGKVREQSTAFVRPNHINPSYFIYTERERLRARELERAKQLAKDQAQDIAQQKAQRAGVAQAVCTQEIQELYDDRQQLVEWRVCVTASGYPCLYGQNKSGGEYA